MIPVQKNDKPSEERFCNCRNSKCLKLYCQCFANGLECNRLCKCTDCRNNKDNQRLRFERTFSEVKVTGIDSTKILRGCSCRKSFCIKKYCECFQEGLLCNQNCKCIECQNNESMTNRNVLIKLKRPPSTSSGKQCSLYPIILSQNADNISSILGEENALNIDDKQMEEDINFMGKVASEGSVQPLVSTFIHILKKIDTRTKLEESTPLKEQNSI